MDPQKLTEEFKRPLTPEQTLPEQNSSEKPMDSKITQLESENPLLHLVGHGVGWSLKNRTTLNKKH